jgi:germination protein M
MGEEKAMDRHRWMKGFLIVGLILMLTTACSIFGSDNAGQEIDPPPDGMQAGDMNVMTNEPAQEVELMTVTLYAKDKNGFIAPLSIEIPKDEGIAKQTLRYMVEGGPVEELLPSGFTPILPKGTEILSMNIDSDKKIATVEFSDEFTNYNVPDERKILEAITWTLTEFPTIDRVQIWVKGTALKEMPMNGMPLDEPLSRAMGINLEDFDEVHLSKASPVTLYFLSQNDDQMQYFVPVTRMIKRTDTPAVAAAMEQLIKGPGSARLSSVIVPTASVLNIEHQDDLITINFNGHVLGENNMIPSETVQSVILSLTEMTGAKKVQFMVEGSVQVKGSDNQSFSQPVTRPHRINNFKM